jgi:hypothetical protein
MHNKILAAARKLKRFTFDDIVMMTDIEESIIKSALRDFTKNNNIKHIGKYFEYTENLKIAKNVRIIDKKINVKSSDIPALEAIKIFLQNCKRKRLKDRTQKEYKSFINAHIIPYFGKALLQNITVNDVKDFKNYLQEKKISERRIKNILTLLNQVIKYFQDEGYIERTCVFEVKRLEKLPKREIQILTPEQLVKLFKIIRKNYPYLEPIITTMKNENKKLNDILTYEANKKERVKRKIREDFYKIKQQLGLEKFVLDDLRFSGHKIT